MYLDCMHGSTDLSVFITMSLFTGEKLYPVVWEVIQSLELYGIEVISLTSDGAKTNRRFYSLCQQESTDTPFKTTNPYSSANPLHGSSNLFLFCDPPHLLKTTRNCFSNSFSHSKSRQLKVIVVCVCVHVCVCVCVTVNHYPLFSRVEEWSVHQLEEH